MRKNKLLDVLFPKIRQQLLAALFLDPERWWYLSDLARRLKVAPSSLQRELSAFTRVGILVRRVEGRQVYFQPNRGCPIFPELKGLLAKTAGVVPILREGLEPFGEEIQVAFVHGSVARSEESSESDVDVVIVGNLGLADIALALREAERQVGRAINPTIYSPESFSKKIREGNHFLLSILSKDKLFVWGGSDDLERLTPTKSDSETQDHKNRTGRPSRRRSPGSQ